MAEFAPTIEKIAGETFIVMAYDGEDSAIQRVTHLAGHLAFVEKNNDRYLVCGPLKQPGEQALIGSCFLLSAQSKEAAMEFLQDDPYFASGMYASVNILSMTPAGGSWLGGVIWDSHEEVLKRHS